MVGEVLTDEESEIKTIVDGLLDQADHLENRARYAQDQERNLGAVAIVSGAATVLVELLPDSTSFEKLFAFGTAGAFAAAAIHEYYRALILNRLANRKRQWAAHTEYPYEVPEPGQGRGLMRLIKDKRHAGQDVI